MLPQPSETWSALIAAITAGKSIGAGNEAATWATGWTTRERRGERPTAMPAGRAQRVPISGGGDDAGEREQAHAREAQPPAGRHVAEEQDELVAAEPERDDEAGEEGAGGEAARARGGSRRAPPRARARALAAGARTLCDEAAEEGDGPGRGAGNRRTRRTSPPGARSPRRGTSAPRRRAGRQRSWSSTTIMAIIATTAQTMQRTSRRCGRDGHVRAQAGEAEVLVAELEGLVDHQEEPAAGHAHHAVPDEAGRGEGQLHPPEAAPPAEAVERGDLDLLARDGPQRVVEAEGHVPGLAGEDHQHRRQLEAHVAVGERGDQREDQAGHEAEHRDALEDVQQGDEDALGDAVLGGPVAVDQREAEREHVGDEAAAEREERVARERPRARGRSPPWRGAAPSTPRRPCSARRAAPPAPPRWRGRPGTSARRAAPAAPLHRRPTSPARAPTCGRARGAWAWAWRAGECPGPSSKARRWPVVPSRSEPDRAAAFVFERRNFTSAIHRRNTPAQAHDAESIRVGLIAA